jgi:TRAP-type transport system periplasmic protein
MYYLKNHKKNHLISTQGGQLRGLNMVNGLRRCEMLVCAFTLTFSVIFPASAQVRWNLPTAYAEGNFHTQNIKQFAEEVKTATGGKLEIVVHSTASLLKLPEIKRGVQTGQVQMGETLMSSLGNEDPIFEASTVPFLAQGFEQARVLMDATRPHVEKRLAAQGITVLNMVPWPTQGLFFKARVGDVGDIKGKKLRAYDRATSRFVELLGAVPTTVQAAEIPQAFATGAIEGMVTSTTTAFDTKAWEYSKAYYDLKAMNSMNMLMVNSRALASLDETSRKAVLDAAARAQSRGWERAQRLEQEMDAKVQQMGIEIVKPSPAMQAAMKTIAQTMSREWAVRAGPDGEAVLKRLGY